MHYTTLKAIPELDGVRAKERNKLVKDAYRIDRRLGFLNLVHGGAVGSCFPIAVILTEHILGHRTLLGSIPAYAALAVPTSILFTRFFIYPRIARALSGIGSIEDRHEHQ